MRGQSDVNDHNFVKQQKSYFHIILIAFVTIKETVLCPELYY